MKIDPEVDESDNEYEMEDNDDEKGEKEEEEENKGNEHLADVFRKLLKSTKPKKKKTLVLSRAKKLADEKIKTEETSDEEEEKDDKKVSDKKHIHKSLRIKPSISDRAREKVLQKIATRGVVQLFNAVKQQQSEIEKKMIDAGPTERKKDKVLKSIDKAAFLDILMGTTKSVEVNSTSA